MNMYYYNINSNPKDFIKSSWQTRIIRSSIELDMVICVCQLDVIRLFGWSYCYTDEFFIYPFTNYK